MPKKILVVEDEIIIALDIQIRLKTLGYQTYIHAASYNQAVNKIDKIKPDLLILDIMLQDGPTGFKIASVAKSKKIPFIFITASTQPSFFKKAISLSPVAVIRKPVADYRLKEALRILW